MRWREEGIQILDNAADINDDISDVGCWWRDEKGLCQGKKAQADCDECIVECLNVNICCPVDVL